MIDRLQTVFKKNHETFGYIGWNLTNVCLWQSIWQSVFIIGSASGLAPSRRQSIIQTNDNLA